MGTLHTLPSGADNEPARELTLSERVAWVNAYERSIVASEGAVVIEIEVYPIETESALPGTSFDRGLRHRFARLVRRDRKQTRTVPKPSSSSIRD